MPPDVERERGLGRHQRFFDIVGNPTAHDVDAHFEVGLVGRALQRVGVHVLAVRRVVQRHPTVGDLGRESDVLRTLGSEQDREIGPQGMCDRTQRLAQTPRTGSVVGHVVVLTVELDRLLTAQDPAHDLDVLACARQRLAERLAVPTLDHLRPRYAETQGEAAVGQVIERECVHRARRRRARRDLHDARAQADP
jgi:hypothetical protein